MTEYKVLWMPEAERTFKKNVEYLFETWTENEVTKYFDRLDEIISLIQSSPEMYSHHKNQVEVRRCVVNKHISLFFRINKSNHTIDLLTFWNNHRDPKKLKI